MGPEVDITFALIPSPEHTKTTADSAGMSALGEIIISPPALDELAVAVVAPPTLPTHVCVPTSKSAMLVVITNLFPGFKAVSIFCTKVIVDGVAPREYVLGMMDTPWI